MLTGWLPIETAPMSNEVIDIWVCSPTGEGFRVANVVRSLEGWTEEETGFSYPRYNIEPLLLPTHWMQRPSRPSVEPISFEVALLKAQVFWMLANSSKLELGFIESRMTEDLRDNLQIIDFIASLSDSDNLLFDIVSLVAEYSNFDWNGFKELAAKDPMLAAMSIYRCFKKESDISVKHFCGGEARGVHPVSPDR